MNEKEQEAEKRKSQMKKEIKKKIGEEEEKKGRSLESNKYEIVSNEKIKRDRE